MNESFNIIVEYHSCGANVVNGVVQVDKVSLYFFQGISLDQVCDVNDLMQEDVSFICVAKRVDREQGERLVEKIISDMKDVGLDIDYDVVYDE